MLDDKFKKVLKFIFFVVGIKEIKWAVVGSVNLVLHGIDIEPKDINIVTDAKGIRVFQELFSNHVKEPFKQEENITHTGNIEKLILEIEGVKVQVIGEPDDGLYMKRLSRVFIDLDGFNIPCASMRTEKEAYIEAGMHGKAELIAAKNPSNQAN